MKTEIFDIEVYENYFLVAFRDVDSGEVKTFEQYDGHPLDVRALRIHLSTRRIVSFNGKRFDIPVVCYAISGASCAELKVCSNAIINQNLQPWQVANKLNFSIPDDWDHIDLFDVAPGMASLKIYAGRMHSVKLQDLPIEHDALITESQREILRDYCINGDTVATLDLWNKLQPQIKLREAMSIEYKIDLRSKSDAQIAESVIKAQIGKLLSKKIERPVIPPGTKYHYKPPFFISFETKELQEVLSIVRSTPFFVSDGGGMLMPKEISNLKLTIGSGSYQMGIGGLHSTESCVSHYADSNHILVDRDVASYYPAIILGCNLFPRHLGTSFLKVYKTLVTRRLDAKHKGDKVTADSLKITINGSFGKLGSKWSALYSPDLLIQTTITGQLALLMLIEMLETNGVSVVSANTDGVVMRCRTDKIETMDAVVTTWEMMTGFETEETHYRALHSRDVNNYIAIKTDGNAKLKGVYAPAGLQKNPTSEICSEAVVKYLKGQQSIDETIRQCTDIRKFVTIRQVKGGGIDQEGNYLGRAVRWYYSNQVTGAIKYKINGYTVARSDRARPMMQLPERIPDDLDFNWYIQEAYSMLNDIGFSQGIA